MTGAADTPPQRIGAYEIRASLGRGGMGEVYLAWDERLQRHVALKRLHADRRDPERTRLRREARAVARLRHPAIVQIHDILDGADDQYLVMEYVEGSTLTELLSRRRIDLGHAVDLAREVAEGLAEAHTKGLVHRDLKADNVIVTATGHAKILDFGLARPLWQGEGSSPPLTRSGALVGTVHAMSPEQAEGRRVDHRSDLFSLGTLMYEMLTGHSPFRGETVLDTLRRVAGEDPEPILQRRPEAPPRLAHLVERLLEKDPGRRPQNASLVAMELQDLKKTTVARSREVEPRLPQQVANSPTASAIHVALSPGAGSEVPPEPAGTPQTVVRTLVLTDLVDRARCIAKLGDQRGAEVWSRHDRMARDLVATWDGVLEIDHGEGFLFLFQRPLEAVEWVLAYHGGLAELCQTLDVELRARAALHLGEVVLRRNPNQDVTRGARPFEVEGLARLTASRVLKLAVPSQTLLTGSAFDLARRALVDSQAEESAPRWLAHGRYLFADLDEPVEVFEVGVPGLAPLTIPPDSENARRAVGIGEEATLGWRPAAGQTIPRRPHWRLRERLGEGGFGESWLAAHKSGEKRVFKFCFEAERLGALKREVTLFRLLREALGQRDDIARVVDWNFELAPYFLESEHTEGGDLAQWAEEQGGLDAVSLSTRIEILAQVAEALDAAHSVGILHKDIKPANVLITEDREGRPRARLTDFGLGLLTQRERLVSHDITALGFSDTASSGERPSGGTWRYMAPEIIEGKPATLQADLYSLGVVLYQIVVGDFARSLATGWQREVDDEILAEDIAGLVDGAPDRRPPRALEVAQRLRHLDERRARRQAERRAARQAERASRRRKVASVVAALSTLVLGLVSVFAVEAIHARRDAERRRRQAEELIDFMLGDLRGKLEEIGRLAILDDVGDEAMAYFAAIPEEDLTPGELLSRSQALSQLGHVRFQRQDLQGATEAFRKSLDLTHDLAQRDPDNPEWQRGLAQSHFWVGFLLLRTRELEGALTHFDAYRSIAQRWSALAPDDPDWRLELAYAHSNIASVLTESSDPRGALRELGTSASLLEDLADGDPGNALFRLELAHVHSKMGTSLKAQGELEAALEHYESALGIHRSLVESEPENFQRLRYLATLHNHLGDVLRMLGQPRRALDHYEADLDLAKRLADQDPENRSWRHELAISHGHVGVAHRALGEIKSAEEHFRTQLTLVEALTRVNPNRSGLRTHLASSHISLASVLLLQDPHRAARPHVDEALHILRPMAQRQPGNVEVHRLLSTSLWLLGRLYATVGDHPQAQASWQEAAATLEPFVRDSRDPLILVPWTKALVSLGQIERARPAVQQLQTLGYQDQEYIDFHRLHGLLLGPVLAVGSNEAPSNPQPKRSNP